MPTKTKTKQTLDIKSVDTPSDLVTTNNQLSVFDYSSLDANTAKLAKESAIEIKAREKAIWENIIEIGNKLIEVKNALPHGQFEEWVNLEFKWHRNTSAKYMKIAKEIKTNATYNVHLPSSVNALYQLASSFSNADEETKEEILTAVEAKTEETGKALTEKEIKELVAEKLGQVKKILSNPREAVKHTNEHLAEQFSLPLDVVAQTRENIEFKRGEEIFKADRTSLENKVKELEKTINNQNKDIQEKNSRLSQLEKKDQELKEKEEQLEKDRQLVADQHAQLNATIDDEAHRKAKIIAEQKLKEEGEKLLKEREDLEKKKAQITKELKEAEQLKKRVEENKKRFDDTTQWITAFALTNNFLGDTVHKLREHRNDLQNTPDLSKLSEDDQKAFKAKIDNLIVEFNSALHELGGQINYLNGAVARFNNHALRVIEAEVSDE